MLITAFNVLQYDKTKKIEIEHQLEIDSLANEIVNLRSVNEFLINSIVEDEVERAKDFEAE